jgi:hypothetical protein
MDSEPDGIDQEQGVTVSRTASIKSTGDTLVTLL